jgi:2-methylcitrate dehydratase PrpD
MGREGDVERIVDGLGEDWHLLSVGWKVYSACASTHTSIEAAERLMASGVKADDLVELEIHMTGPAVAYVGWPYRPADKVAAQMNVSYAVAVQLVDGRVGLEQFADDRLAAGDLLDVVRRISIHHEPAYDALGPTGRQAVRLVARTGDGQTRLVEVRDRRGGERRPLTRADLLQKFHGLLDDTLPPGRADALAQAALRLPDAPDVSGLVAALSAAADTS